MFETTTQQCVLVGDDGTSYGNLPSTNQPNQPKKNPNDVPLPTIKTSGGSPPPGNSDCEHFEKGGLGIGTREVVLVMQNYGLLDDPFIMHRYEDHENDEDWRMFFFSKASWWWDFWFKKPEKKTWNLQITHLERKMIFQTFIFGFHVNLQGCKTGVGNSRDGWHLRTSWPKPSMGRTVHLPYRSTTAFTDPWMVDL